MQSFRQYRQIAKYVAEATSADSRSDSAEHRVKSNPNLFNVNESGVKKETGTDKSILQVEWDGPLDALNPRNWSLTRRSWVLFILWINVFAVDWASAADSQASSKIIKDFGISKELETLSPALYTFGLAGGSLFAGPLSETFGRNPVYVGSRIFHVIWLLGAALAPNFAAQLVFRLFAGLSGSIILAIHAASTADLFSPLERTAAWPIIALASFWASAASPVVGGWIAQSQISWRWTEWIALILSGFTLIFTIFFLPETFAPVLLSWKARHLRQTTNNEAYMSELDMQHTLAKRVHANFRRAFRMVLHEPIVVVLGIWLVIEYLVVFGFLQGFSFIFGDTYKFSKGLVGSCFIAIVLGSGLWTCVVPIYYILYRHKTEAIQNGRRNDEEMKSVDNPGDNLPEPEYRLWSAMPVAFTFPISLFWLGWTNNPDISKWSSLGAVVLLGVSWAGIYVSVYQYILDVYGIYAGSALAMITCWRYLAAGTTNLISDPMYQGLGVHWTLTLLGVLAVVLLPAPFVLFKYGARVRACSEFASGTSKR